MLFFPVSFLGPPNGTHFRAFGFPQRPYPDASLSSHFRELTSLHRVTRSSAAAAAAASMVNSSATPASTTGSTASGSLTQLVGSSGNHSPTSSALNSDCQGYKPNATHIQGNCNTNDRQRKKKQFKLMILFNGIYIHRSHVLILIADDLEEVV